MVNSSSSFFYDQDRDNIFQQYQIVTYLEETVENSMEKQNQEGQDQSLQHQKKSLCLKLMHAPIQLASGKITDKLRKIYLFTPLYPDELHSSFRMKVEKDSQGTNF